MRFDDPELATVLNDPGQPGGCGEFEPSPQFKRRLVEVYDLLKADKFDEALRALQPLMKVDLSGCPCYAMRRVFYLSRAHFGLNEYDVAREHLVEAGDFAVRLNDYAAQAIVWTDCAETYYQGASDYSKTADDYLTALAALDRDQRSAAPVKTKFRIRILWRLARHSFHAGEYSKALDCIAEARTLRNIVGAPAMSARDRASEAWIEGLIARSESERCGGDGRLLRHALRCFTKARDSYDPSDTPLYLLGRLYIQIAHTYLDMVELHQRGESARSCARNLKQAYGACMTASNLLQGAGDEIAVALLTITLFRHELLGAKAHELPGLLYELDQMRARFSDRLLLAHLATLSGDIQLSSGECYMALQSYNQALVAFEDADARGESARALYGSDRAREELRTR